MNKHLLRVLLVEADQDDFVQIRNLLDEITTFDCKTQRAATYSAAKKAIAKNTFDVCLIDYCLDKHTGLELLREAIAGGFRAPMILLTAEDDCAIDLEALKTGAADYLVKGTMKAALLERTIHFALERSRTQMALEAAAKRARTILDNAPDVICTIDAKGYFVTINHACFKMLGYQPEELIGRQYTDFVVPEDTAKTNAAAESILSGEKVIDFENCYQHKNGTPVNLIWTCNWSEAEQVVFALAHDITERKRDEEAIRQSEEKYRNILETIEEGYFETDLSGKFTFFNDALCDSLGYTRAELMELTYKDYVDEENAKKLYKIFVAVYETNQSGIISSWEIIRKNGERRMHESPVSLLRNAANKPIGFRGLVRDITECKRAEDELRQSQEWLAAMFEVSQDGIIVEENEHIVFANKRCLRMFGYEVKELIGSHVSQFQTAEDKERMIEYGRMRQRGEDVPSIYEFKGISKNGKEKDFEASISTFTSNGKFYIVTAQKDITERKQSEEALRVNEAKFRDLFDNAPVAYHELDTEGRFTRINHTEELMLGYTNDELKGRRPSEIIVEKVSREATEAKLAGKMPLQAVERTFIRKDGTLVSVLNEDRLIYDADGKVTGIRSTLQNITDRKRIEEQLLHDAFHDGLTDLANRTFFIEHLQMTIERTRRDRSELFAVLFLDFDRFKVVNDSLGHAEGDNLLKQFARRIKSSLRSGDLAARIGGDEFAILLNKINNSSAALKIAERIQKSLEIPFEIGGGEIFISASIGIALSTSEHDTAEDMLRDADIAMYRAKAKGKARYQVFDQAMHEQALVRLRIETELRQAIERKEFCLHYQPIFSLETNRTVGFESLVRWKHPTFGMIPPNDFIPIAEENGLIIPLGQWILHESCLQMREWQISNPAAAAFKVSVNLSFKQFLKSDLAEQVAETLAETGLDPKCLKLEITESHLMENSEKAIVMMNRLCALGVELSLDDFGTGYSSLSYLHRLPVNYLKIDRSFVNRMIESEENSEIVRTIIKLAQNLKMKVIAEGIETAEQLVQLKILNCEYGQGYFFAKPMEAKAAEIFIDRSPENPAYLISQPLRKANLNNVKSVRKRKINTKNPKPRVNKTQA